MAEAGAAQILADCRRENPPYVGPTPRRSRTSAYRSRTCTRGSHPVPGQPISRSWTPTYPVLPPGLVHGDTGKHHPCVTHYSSRSIVTTRAFSHELRMTRTGSSEECAGLVEDLPEVLVSIVQSLVLNDHGTLDRPDDVVVALVAPLYVDVRRVGLEVAPVPDVAYGAIAAFPIENHMALGNLLRGLSSLR